MRKRNRRKKAAQKVRIDLEKAKARVEWEKYNAILLDYAATHPRLAAEEATQSSGAAH